MNFYYLFVGFISYMVHVQLLPNAFFFDEAFFSFGSIRIKFPWKAKVCSANKTLAARTFSGCCSMESRALGRCAFYLDTILPELQGTTSQISRAARTGPGQGMRHSTRSARRTRQLHATLADSVTNTLSALQQSEGQAAVDMSGRLMMS